MQLNEFPQSSRITIESREIFEAAYIFLPPFISDIAFSSLFSWQDIYPYRLSKLGPFLIVHYTADGKLVVLPPLLLQKMGNTCCFKSALKTASDTLAGFCAKNKLKLEFRFFPEFMLKYLEKEGYTITADRDAFDYIYKRSDLEKLPGQKFQPKRNLISQFQRKYKYSFEPLTEKNSGLIYKLLENSGNPADAKVVGRLLDNFKALGLSGMLITGESGVIAATIGSVVKRFIYKKACRDIAVVHFEKARLEYKGAYQMINNLYCASLPEQIEYVNREEDLGLEGLRKAKLSYNPDKLLEKFTLSPKI